MNGKLLLIFSFILLTFLATTISLADLVDGLVSYWPLNGNTNDIVGGNNGNIIGNATFVNDDERGEVLSPDGAGGHMEVPHADNIAFISDTTLSISIWVKPSSLPRSVWTTIFAKNRDVHYNNAYGMWISTNNNFHFRVGAASGDGSIAASEGWHHLAMRHDPSITTLQGFVDGQLAYNNTSASPGTLGDTELRVGASKNHETKLIFEPYPGLIDDLAIYNRVLDDTEIQELASGAEIPAVVEPDAKLATAWGSIKSQ